jgi:hypothetical protein
VRGGRTPAEGAPGGPAPPATASTQAATPGYAAFTITLDQGVPGPTTADPRLEIVPLVHLAGGGRLFDHNRNAGALDNYVLTAPDLAVWRDDMVCTPPSGPEAATLVFGADWSVQRQGVLAPGGQVTLAYATSRLGQCAEEQAGHLRWGITAHVTFEPGGEQRDASVVTGAATMPVPADTRQMIVYFEATNADGCHAYDSAYGANYAFPAMTAPAWLGNADNLITRDDSGDICGGTGASSGVTFDTWARQQAAITNLCFEVYQPGVTDTDANPWQALDSTVYWRASGATAWNAVPVDFDRRVGNNARYALSWRGIDPFRPDHCPDVPVTASSDGQYVQAQLESYIDVNGAQLRPEPGAAFAATFIDYAQDPWRTANCP